MQPETSCLTFRENPRRRGRKELIFLLASNLVVFLGFWYIPTPSWLRVAALIFCPVVSLIAIAFIVPIFSMMRARHDLLLVVDRDQRQISYESPLKHYGPSFSIPFSDVAEIDFEIDQRGEDPSYRLRILTLGGEKLEIGRNSLWRLKEVARQMASAAGFRLMETVVTREEQKRTEILLRENLPTS
jgi:hypothetical protein